MDVGHSFPFYYIPAFHSLQQQIITHSQFTTYQPLCHELYMDYLSLLNNPIKWVLFCLFQMSVEDFIFQRWQPLEIPPHGHLTLGLCHSSIKSWDLGSLLNSGRCGGGNLPFLRLEQTK